MSELRKSYQRRFEQVLSPAAQSLETHIKGCLQGYPRIDRISARAKSIDRFIQKAQKLDNGNPKYTDPLNQIQDQIGARIVSFYLSDIESIANEVRRYFHPIEEKRIVPDGDSEFGYEGKHYILLVPSDIAAEFESNPDLPAFFELQIKTLFQHAWAEAEHDLGYKQFSPLSVLQKRKIAFTAAQAWGADQIFDELFREVELAKTKAEGNNGR